MNKQKWSPEPWETDTMPNEIDLRRRGDWIMLGSSDWFRARECVNACAGIEDPAAALAAAREALGTACYGIYSEPENVRALAQKALALLTPKQEA